MAIVVVEHSAGGVRAELSLQQRRRERLVPRLALVNNNVLRLMTLQDSLNVARRRVSECLHLHVFMADDEREASPDEPSTHRLDQTHVGDVCRVSDGLEASLHNVIREPLPHLAAAEDSLNAGDVLNERPALKHLHAIRHAHKCALPRSLYDHRGRGAQLLFMSTALQLLLLSYGTTLFDVAAPHSVVPLDPLCAAVLAQGQRGLDGREVQPRNVLPRALLDYFGRGALLNHTLLPFVVVEEPTQLHKRVLAALARAPIALDDAYGKPPLSDPTADNVPNERGAHSPHVLPPLLPLVIPHRVHHAVVHIFRESRDMRFVLLHCTFFLVGILVVEDACGQGDLPILRRPHQLPLCALRRETCDVPLRGSIHVMDLRWNRNVEDSRAAAVRAKPTGVGESASRSLRCL
eukprot:PhM_4_TR18624/c0_g1_i1/m.27272